MEKPDQIPKEVWELARAAFAELYARYVADGKHEFQIVVVIALAIMRDRDENAKA